MFTMRGHLITLFLVVFAAVFLVAQAGHTSLNNNGKQQQQQQPMFSSEQIARSAIRQRAQEEILSKSRLDRGKSPGSPQSPQTPLSGGSGVASPGQPGSRFSPDISARQSPRKPATYLQDPPPPRGGVKPNVVSPPINSRKPSCASLCQTVYQQPARPVCIFDSALKEFVPLRNTAHIACYKCLNPNSAIEVRPNQSDCDGQSPRHKRFIGQ